MSSASAVQSSSSYERNFRRDDFAVTSPWLLLNARQNVINQFRSQLKFTKF